MFCYSSICLLFLTTSTVCEFEIHLRLFFASLVSNRIIYEINLHVDFSTHYARLPWQDQNFTHSLCSSGDGKISMFPNMKNLCFSFYVAAIPGLVEWVPSERRKERLRIWIWTDWWCFNSLCWMKIINVCLKLDFQYVYLYYRGVA